MSQTAILRAQIKARAPRSRAWFGTVWLEEDIELLKAQKTTFTIISADDFTEEEQLHWHCLLKYENQRVRPPTKSAHWEIPEHLFGALNYIMEKGTPKWETGELNLNSRDPKDWESFTEACKRCTPKEMIDGPFSKMYARYMTFYGQVHIQFRDQRVMDGELPHEWWWGPAGSGKTSKAFSEYPDLYIKPLSKWWDGYNDQEVVLIDDWSPDHAMLVNHLKHWADRYPFAAEIKGSMMQIRPKKIIITSNYPIESCFEREEDQMALKRRFKVTRFHGENWFRSRQTGPETVNN